MKKKPNRESKKLLCPEACVLNQLDDDRARSSFIKKSYFKFLYGNVFSVSSANVFILK